MFRGVRIEKVTVFSRLDGEKPPYHNGPRRRVVRAIQGRSSKKGVPHAGSLQARPETQGQEVLKGTSQGEGHGEPSPLSKTKERMKAQE